MVTVLKTVVGQLTASSNLALSATLCDSHGGRFAFQGVRYVEKLLRRRAECACCTTASVRTWCSEVTDDEVNDAVSQNCDDDTNERIEDGVLG